MRWIITQAILFLLILFLPFKPQFAVNETLSSLLRILSWIGFAVLVKAVYDLRHSLAVSPTPNKNGKLQTHGIYRYLRHPMYLAVWLIFLDGAIESGSYLKIFLFILLVIFFVIKTHHEESLLINKYSGYKEYKDKTPAYFPKIKK